MSPTYGSSAIDTIQGESREHRIWSNTDHELEKTRISGPRTAAHRFSALSEQTNKTHRSGSPQLHHFLKASSPVSDDGQKSYSIPVTQRDFRRNSSGDIALLKDKIGYDTPFTLDKENWSSKHLQDARVQKRVKVSPTTVSQRPVPPRPASFTLGGQRPQSSSKRSPIICESSQEAQVDDHSTRDAGATTSNDENVSTAEVVLSLERDLQTVISSASPDALAALERAIQPLAADSRGHEVLVRDDLDDPTTPVIRLSPTREPFSSDSSESGSPHSDCSSEKTTATNLTSGDDHVYGGDYPIAPVPVHISGHLCLPAADRPSLGSERDSYGTPEMPRGSAKLPHIPPSSLTSRARSHSHAKHLPRAEKLPMSGYELLASTITSSSSASRRKHAGLYPSNPDSPHMSPSRRGSATSFMAASPSTSEEDSTTIKPIYRKFESLNNRLLLHLQDELSELEEQLHRLDTTDTQTRRMQSHIMPASRRAEHLSGGELQLHKTDILGRIASKLGQYNHALSTFTSTRDLPAPSSADVDEYRSYLTTRRLISEEETRFIDYADDLVTLAANENSRGVSTNLPEEERRPSTQQYLQSLRINDEPIVTPIPGTMHGNSWLVRHNRITTGSRSSAVSSTHSMSPRFGRPQSLEPFSQPISPRMPPSPRLPTSPRRNGYAKPGSTRRDNTEAEHETGPQAQPVPNTLAQQSSATLAVAVLLPILAFAFVPGLAARMGIVISVALSIFNPVLGLRSKHGFSSRSDLARRFLGYTFVMAIAAGVTR